MAAAAASEVVHTITTKKRKQRWDGVIDWPTFVKWAKDAKPGVVYRINVEITRITLWAVLLAQVDDFHLIYSHDVRFKLVGDKVSASDADLEQFIQTRWKQHANHPLVTGLPLNTKPSATTPPRATPPLGLNTALIFTLHT